MTKSRVLSVLYECCILGGLFCLKEALDEYYVVQTKHSMSVLDLLL
jgi:hypothetical protein